MKRYWWLLLVLILLLLWWSFGGSSSAPTIHFATARPTTISNTVSTNGKVEPAEFSAARADLAARLSGALHRPFQRVRAGQELLALDPVAAQADLAAAQARVEEAQSELNVLKQGGKASAVADLDDRIRAARETVSTAQRIYDSDKRLFAQQATTRVQLNTDADSLTRAQLNLAALENQKKTVVTSSDRSVAEARLKDARSALALAQHRTGLSIIRSPMDGTIYDFDLKVGTYLEPGKLVAYIGNLDQVKVTVDVDEPDLGRARLNVPVSITTDSHPGKVWWGRVDKLPTQVIALNNRTVGQVSTVIDNPDHDLLPGMSVTATIVSSVVKDALVIPKAALRRLSNKDGAYKLEGNVIHWVAVKVGISDINNVQIVSGLQQGDHVVDRAVDPADAEISDGMRVKAVY